LTAQATILEDVFEPIPAVAQPEESKELVLASEAVSAAPPPPRFAPAVREWGRRGVTPPPPREVEPERAAKPPASQLPPSPPSLKNAPAPQKMKGRDRYAFGVQMLRVSPAWLVVGGVAFVSLIVLCTWLIKPARQEEQFGTAQPPTRNQATNQRPADAPNVPVPAAQTAKPPAASQTEATKPAEAKPAEVKPAEAKPAPALVPDGKFTVQIGSFPDEAQAKERVNRLKAAGFEGRVVVAQIPNRGTWYRVQAGRFADRTGAGTYGSQVRSKGVAESVIVTEVEKQ
ncbi:MAG TPA: SPOR domain-containing protein, partial [Pyrinomonadaceae bacterium]|nr:SPOR domain-containing protein [Pyrinomonadaceae bacterium]